MLGSSPSGLQNASLTCMHGTQAAKINDKIKGRGDSHILICFDLMLGQAIHHSGEKSSTWFGLHWFSLTITVKVKGAYPVWLWGSSFIGAFFYQGTIISLHGLFWGGEGHMYKLTQGWQVNCTGLYHDKLCFMIFDNNLRDNVHWKDIKNMPGFVCRPP